MAVVILGMHRSGTSALARCVNLMGLSVGPSEALYAPAPDNPRGFWEIVKLTELNDEILSACGGSSTLPPSLKSGWWHEPGLADLKARCRAALIELFGSSTHWCWKDPRTCLTLPLWLDVMPVRPLVVFIHRHPIEVARSLHARDALSIDECLGLWTVYVCNALAHMSGLPVFVLGFDELLARPMEILAQLAEFMTRHGEAGVRVPAESDIREFLAPELRHWQNADDVNLAGPEASADPIAIHAVLSGLPRSSDFFVPPTWPDRVALLENLARLTLAAQRRVEKHRENACNWLEDQRATWERQATGAEVVIGELRAELAGKSKQLADAAEALSTASTQSSTYVRELAALHGVRDQCEELRALLVHAAKRVEQFRTRGDTLEQSAAQQSREIVALQASLTACQSRAAALNRLLSEIESSRAWWCLSLWRRIRHGFLRDPGSIFRGPVRIPLRAAESDKGTQASET